MKFGLEAEKILFNQSTGEPSTRVFNFLHGLSDFEISESGNTPPKITNEFVLNMVEFGTTPSARPMDVLKDYILHFLLMRKVALREEVAMVPLASLPMVFIPHMTSKWGYYVQNSILAGKKLSSWMIDEHSPLKAAGNCTGVHVHSEIETRPEFLFAGRELQDKFNMGLMTTPMIAFSSSPYMFENHTAVSMRGQSYFFETYKRFPLNGGLPPVMASSGEVLNFVKAGIELWESKAVNLGFLSDEVRTLTKKGANWNPVRWNPVWNTIEVRCLESDSLELDCAKFLWVIGAMKRMDLNGEALRCVPIKSSSKLDLSMLNEVFSVSGNEVAILSTQALTELFGRAIRTGLKDELVASYLKRLRDFSMAALSAEERRVASLLDTALQQQKSTADRVLELSSNKPRIEQKNAIEIVNVLIARQESVLKDLRGEAPDIFAQLERMTPHI